MSDLSPEDRALVDRGGRDDLPSRDARDRVRRRLALRLGAAAGLGAAGAATKTAAAMTLTTKVLLSIALVGAIGVGGAAIGIASRSHAPAATASGTAPGVATSAGLASPPLPVAAPLSSEPATAPEPEPSASSAAPTLPTPPAPRVGRAGALGTTRAPSDAPATPAEALAEETRLLREANAATRAGDTARARALLDEHARRFPRGVLAEERDAERVLSLCAAGRTDEARAAAARFLATHPHSTLGARVRASCGVP